MYSLFSLRVGSFLSLFLLSFPLAVFAAPPITNKTLSDQMLIFQQQMERRFEELTVSLQQKGGGKTAVSLQDFQQLQGKMDEIGYALASLQVKVEALAATGNGTSPAASSGGEGGGGFPPALEKELAEIKTSLQDLGYKVYLVESSLSKKLNALQDDVKQIKAGGGGMHASSVVASQQPAVSATVLPPAVAVSSRAEKKAETKQAVPVKVTPPATMAPSVSPPASSPVTQKADDVKPKSASLRFGGMEESYKAAYNDFLRQNYELAIMGFTSFLENFPQTSLSDNAQYWIGESYYSEAKYEEAKKAFVALLDRYPDSNKRGEAIFKIARCYDKLKNSDAARKVYQRVISEYPGTSIAERSDDYLNKLEVSPQE